MSELGVIKGRKYPRTHLLGRYAWTDDVVYIPQHQTPAATGPDPEQPITLRPAAAAGGHIFIPKDFTPADPALVTHQCQGCYATRKVRVPAGQTYCDDCNEARREVRRLASHAPRKVRKDLNPDTLPIASIAAQAAARHSRQRP